MSTLDLSPTHGFPDPTPAEDSLPFWTAATDGRLHIQRCEQCARGIFPPRPALCPYCHGHLAWVDAPPECTVYSWVGIDKAIHEWTRSAVPFTVVIAALAAYPDVRIPAYFAGARASLRKDAPGKLSFPQIGRKYPLVHFELG